MLNVPNCLVHFVVPLWQLLQCPSSADTFSGASLTAVRPVLMPSLTTRHSNLWLSARAEKVSDVGIGFLPTFGLQQQHRDIVLYEKSLRMTFNFVHLVTPFIALCISPSFHLSDKRNLNPLRLEIMMLGPLLWNSQAGFMDWGDFWEYGLTSRRLECCYENNAMKM